MNRAALIEHMAKETGASKAVVGRFLDSFIQTVTTTVKEGGELKLAGFGKFGKAKVAARRGRNPTTRELLSIPETVRPRFTPGAVFKAAVKQA
jgi:DNA-binding protein HU-beta